TVTTTHRCYLVVRKEQPVPIFLPSEQRRKTSRRIEPGKAKPIDAAVATHQRARLRVAKERVVLDFCIFLRHLFFLFLLASEAGRAAPQPCEGGFLSILLLLLVLLLLLSLLLRLCSDGRLGRIRQFRDLITR